ncbi:exodeoxyribonuclease VII large subunit [Desulfitibacter alkalitolerans]|uniref:exodeoxyribonuclease VII large subunit n=1 Tax=Desulfitibacter alkalitolerans TaxID=264641 RepID=UPI000485CD89|nr:exodeoxyribonuclease VII large subunit [Desulfitibacter alkalitolerans]
MVRNQKVLTVTQLTEYLKNIIETDARLSNLWLRGEVSNATKPSSGHLYLTLKDEECTLKAVMFRSDYTKLLFKVENGLEVVVRGRIAIYQKGGIYQLYIQEMFPQGIGSLELAFQQLKEALANKGYFDPASKKPIPKMPHRIGIVTSPTGSVIRDFLKVVRRRFPAVDIFLIPTTVQGEEAPPQITRAIKIFNEEFPVDVIVLARGGGSLEELWAFNTEEVARAIFASKIPIVSAVGHETDFTIADWVADLRAATPSVAGELVVLSLEELKNRLNKLERHLYQSANSMIKHHLEKLNGIEKRLHLAGQGLILKKENQLAKLAVQLDALSPLKVLQRGYSVCQDVKGQTVLCSSQVDVGDQVTIILKKGSLGCAVSSKID